MNQWQWDAMEDDGHLEVPTPLGRKYRGKMPVASEARAKAASKATWRSRQATKRVARLHGSIRNRRQKRVV
jgi:hypothetical protein